MKLRLPAFLIAATCSLLAAAQTPVEINGKLKVTGVQLMNENGNPVQLRGMSSHGLQWYGNCITEASLKSMRDDWGADIFRPALYVGEGGYASNKSLMQTMKNIIDWTEKLGIYCLVDWHVRTPGNPNDAAYADAPAFFDEISKYAKDKKHVLYEICNEPNTADVSWSEIVKYAKTVIPKIKGNDPNAVVMVGTPRWSQMLETVKTSDLSSYSNIMYSFHFYSASHSGLMNTFKEYICKIPVFVTEWGTPNANGDAVPDTAESRKWINIMKGANSCKVTVSWCNWNFADKSEGSSALKPGSCSSGSWTNTTLSGGWVRTEMRIADKFTPINTTSVSISSASYDPANGYLSILASSALATLPAGAQNLFSVKINGKATTISSIGLNPSNAKEIRLFIAPATVGGETITVSYTGTTITSTDSKPLQAFADKATSNLTPLPSTGGAAGDDFNDNSLAAGWDKGEVSTLTETGSELKIDAAANGYKAFTFSFDAIDITANPIVKVRVKSATAFTLRADLQSCAGATCYTTNSSAVTKEISGANTYTEYTFDFTGKFLEKYDSQGNPRTTDVPVDSKNISKVLFIANPGSTLNSTFYMDDLQVGVKQTTAPVVKTALANTISSSASALNGAAGNYPAANISALTAELAKAKTEYANTAATQAEVDAANQALASQLAAFNASKLTPILSALADHAKIYPQPAADQLIVGGSKAIRASISTLSGQPISSTETNCPPCELSTAGLASGSYILTLTYQDGSTQSQVILKK